MLNSIPMSLLYILTACMRVSSSFAFFANDSMSSIYIRWLIFSCDLLNLGPVVHFLSMWFSGIMVIMDSKGDSVSPWKTTLWIFISAICTLWGSYYPALWNHVICLFGVNQAIARFFYVWSYSYSGCVDLCKVILLCFWILCSILSVRQGTIRGLFVGSKSFLLFVLFELPHHW